MNPVKSRGSRYRLSFQLHWELEENDCNYKSRPQEGSPFHNHSLRVSACVLCNQLTKFAGNRKQQTLSLF